VFLTLTHLKKWPISRSWYQSLSPDILHHSTIFQSLPPFSIVTIVILYTRYTTIFHHFPRVFLKNFPGSHGVLGRRSSAWGGRLSRDPAGGDFPLHPSAANGLEGYPAGRSEGLQRFIFSGEHSKKVWKHTIKMSSGKLHRQKNAVNLCKSQVQNNQNI